MKEGDEKRETERARGLRKGIWKEKKMNSKQSYEMEKKQDVLCNSDKKEIT